MCCRNHAARLNFASKAVCSVAEDDETGTRTKRHVQCCLADVCARKLMKRKQMLG